MARTAITPQAAPGPYPGTIAAGDADFVWTAADVANKNQAALTGREVLLVRNIDAGAQTVSVTSTGDIRNRTGDVSAYSLAAGDFAVFGPFSNEGWKQTDGQLYFEASSASVQFAVLKLPQF